MNAALIHGTSFVFTKSRIYIHNSNTVLFLVCLSNAKERDAFVLNPIVLSLALECGLQFYFGIVSRYIHILSNDQQGRIEYTDIPRKIGKRKKS